MYNTLQTARHKHSITQTATLQTNSKRLLLQWLQFHWLKTAAAKVLSVAVPQPTTRFLEINKCFKNTSHGHGLWLCLRLHSDVYTWLLTCKILQDK